jgi:Ca2+/H+ antiporter, TMEM165/GDT1 family
MFQEYLQAFMLIFIAEMGDKTQILSMAFATRYKIRQILVGVAIGAFFNHGIAILLGSLITRFIPIDLLQLFAGIMFIFFAFWTLSSDGDDDDEGVGVSRFGPIITVALAFFMGELGDKTQLTALTFAASSSYPQVVLLGTVSGMVMTSLIGVIVGMSIGKNIPELQLKLGAFSVFMFFGIQKIVVSKYMTGNVRIALASFLVIALVLSFFRIRAFIAALSEKKESVLRKRAEELYRYTHKMNDVAHRLCLGIGTCGMCIGEKCLVGNLKAMLGRAIEESHTVDRLYAEHFQTMTIKRYSKEAAFEAYQMLHEYYSKYPDEYVSNNMVSNVRDTIEMILFGSIEGEFGTYDEYKIHIAKKYKGTEFEHMF